MVKRATATALLCVHVARMAQWTGQSTRPPTRSEASAVVKKAAADQLSRCDEGLHHGFIAGDTGFQVNSISFAKFRYHSVSSDIAHILNLSLNIFG